MTALWLCLFVLGVVGVIFSMRDLQKRRANPATSFQIPWTMAVAAVTINSLVQAVRPLSSPHEAKYEITYTAGVIALLWCGLVVRAAAHRRKSQY